MGTLKRIALAVGLVLVVMVGARLGLHLSGWRQTQGDPDVTEARVQLESTVQVELQDRKASCRERV